MIHGFSKPAGLPAYLCESRDSYGTVPAACSARVLSASFISVKPRALSVFGIVSRNEEEEAGKVFVLNKETNFLPERPNFKDMFSIEQPPHEEMSLPSHLPAWDNVEENGTYFHTGSS
jgi:hypothetical protein